MMPDGFHAVHFDMHIAEEIGRSAIVIQHYKPKGLTPYKGRSGDNYENQGKKTDVEDVETYKKSHK